MSSNLTVPTIFSSNPTEFPNLDDGNGADHSVEDVAGDLGVQTGTIEKCKKEESTPFDAHFLAVNYLIPDKDGPPFGTTRRELWRRFSRDFDLLEEWVPRTYPDRKGL